MALAIVAPVAKTARWRARHIVRACAALLIPAALAAAPGAAVASVPSCSVWSGVPAPNEGAAFNSLTGVTALSPCNVWAVGYYQDVQDGMSLMLAEHWNGTSWAVSLPPGPDTNFNILEAVSASSLDHVWAVGLTGVATYIARWNGSFWARVPSPSPSSSSNNLGGVAAVSNTSAWAVGRFVSGSSSAVLVLHWNGTNWTRQAAPTPGSDGEFRGVAALSSRNAWAVGDISSTASSSEKTLIEHWNGSKWARVPSPNPRNATGDISLDGVDATAASNVWAVGSYTSGHQLKTLVEHWNGRSWNIVASPSPGSSNILDSVTAASARSAWAVGVYNSHGKQKTLIEHWNGRAWAKVASPSPGAVSGLSGVAATGASGVWAVGQSTSGAVTHVLVAHCC
jgi:hypothetical protein